MSKVHPLLESFKGIFGMGLYLLLTGFLFETLTIFLRQWVSFPVSMSIRTQIALTMPCVLFSLLMVVWFNYSLNLVQVHFKADENKLITQGPYNYVRHPLYATLLLTLPPLFIIWYADLLFIAPWVLIVISAHFIVIVEEQRLITTFGDSYKRYQRYVPMLVPYKGAAGVRFREEPDRVRSDEITKI